MSPTVLALLRERLRYDGVIVTDALDMAGASGNREIPEAAVLSLIAGADLLCLGSNSSPDLIRAVQAAVVAAVADRRLTEERLADAQRRIGTLRMTEAPAATELDAQAQLAGARAALTVEGDLPDLAGAAVTQIDTTPNIAVGVVPWGLPAMKPSAAGRPVIVQVKDAHRAPRRAGPAGLARRGRPGRGGGVRLAGSTRARASRICTRSASRPSTAAVAEVLTEAGWSA